MSALHLVEFHLDQTALLRFLAAQGIGDTRHDPDLGYGVHAWLKAAFADLAPRPWRLLADRRRPPRVLAYSRHPAAVLVEQMCRFAEPMVQAVSPPEAIAGKAMPQWTSGQELGFQLLSCPVGRKARQGTEKDLFLLAAERAPDERHDRAAIYVQAIRHQLQAGGVVEVDRLWLEGFRRVHQLRKTQGPMGERAPVHLERPEALIGGVLHIVDPDGFGLLLANGIGRHRAFGYGMLLLKPPGR